MKDHELKRIIENQDMAGCWFFREFAHRANLWEFSPALCSLSQLALATKCLIKKNDKLRFESDMALLSFSDDMAMEMPIRNG